MIRHILLRKLLAVVMVVTCSFLVNPNSAFANQRAEAINIFVDPDFPLPAGDSLLSFYRKKNFTFMYKEIIPLVSANTTYFEILGSNGEEYPDFYGGIQQLHDGSKAAIFSAWDVGSPCCANVQPGSAPIEKQVTVLAKGNRTITRPFGGEGTGMNSMIYNFDWKINEKVSMLAEIEPAGDNSIISAAIRIGDGPWEYMTSFLIPKKIDAGMPGGVSFIEDYGPGSPTPLKRSMLVGPSIVANEFGEMTVFTNYYISASSPSLGHKITIQGDKLLAETGLENQTDTRPDYRFTLSKPLTLPDFTEAIKLIESFSSGASTKYQERLIRLKLANELAAQKAAEEAKAKEIAAANAEAEEKARAELDALAEAAAAAKVAADLKAKQNSAKVSQRKKVTITCVKGKLTKKVTAFNPKCPSGYKKK
jgi:hypothetical protein